MAELKTAKLVSKDKEQELKSVKSDCAGALMAKEKTLASKLIHLENEVSDLQFEKQKLVQQLHDRDSKLKEQMEDLNYQNE